MPSMGDISDDEGEADADGFMAARKWEEHIAWLRSKSREALFSEDSEDDEDDEQESAGVRFRGKSATQDWWGERPRQEAERRLPRDRDRAEGLSPSVSCLLYTSPSPRD